MTQPRWRLSQKNPSWCGFLSSSPSPSLTLTLSPLNPSICLPYSFSPRLPDLGTPPARPPCQTSHFDPHSYSFHVPVGLISTFSRLPQARSLILSLIHATNSCGARCVLGTHWGCYEEHSVEVRAEKQDSQQGGGW